MRENLKNINGVRAKFTGRFVRYGTRRTYTGGSDTTILLREIRDETGELRTNHLWFHNCKAFQNLGELQGGEEIEFYARVTPYKKRYRGLDSFERLPEIDYKLSYPTSVRLTGRAFGTPGNQLQLNLEVKHENHSNTSQSKRP